MLAIIVNTMVFAVLCFSMFHVFGLMFGDRIKRDKPSSIIWLVSVYLICGYITLSLGEYLSH